MRGPNRVTAVGFLQAGAAVNSGNSDNSGCPVSTTDGPQAVPV